MAASTAEVLPALEPQAASTGGERVEISHVSKTFKLPGGRPFVALSDISIDVSPGELLSLVGPSGCGKSTLLRAICGLVPLESGTIRIGTRTPELLTADHRLGVAFQDHALLPWLSVFENVALPYRLAGLPIDRERVDSLVRLVGLTEFARARPKQLSGGMRQRVSIARAIAMRPVVLLLDEPFGALDLVTRRTLNLEMQRIWAELGTTTILVTHSVDEAVQIGDRVVVMSARPGRIHAEFAIDLPRPRDRELTTSADFLEIVRTVSIALDDATGASGSDPKIP